MEFIVKGKFVTEVMSVTEIMLRMCVCVCVYTHKCVCVNVTFLEALPTCYIAVLCKMR